MNSLGDWDFRPILADINARSLIICGKNGSLPERPKEWAAWLPNSRILGVDNAKGFIWVEHPETVFESCKTFIKGRWPENSIKIDKGELN